MTKKNLTIDQESCNTVSPALATVGELLEVLKQLPADAPIIASIMDGATEVFVDYGLLDIDENGRVWLTG